MSRGGIRLTFVLLAAVTAGCGAGQPGSSVGAAPPGHTLRVGLVEWRIVTSSRGLLAGADRITVTNAGTVAHDLHVSGPGVHAHTPLLEPGGTATLSVRPRTGSSLELTCEVPGHEQAGMTTTVGVAG